MPRRRGYGRKRYGRMARRAMRYGRYGMVAARRLRGVTKPYVTFTETFRAPTPQGGFLAIQANAGGIFNVAFNMLPQFQNYSALYHEFALRKLQVILVPRYNITDANVGPPDYYLPRICWAVNDSPDQILPVSETEVLTDNGAKIANLNKKVIINCYPKPNIDAAVNGIGSAAIRQRKLTWFNTVAVGNNPLTTGVNVPHGSIVFWCANNTANQPLEIADVYYRLTFSLRDPA